MVTGKSDISSVAVASRVLTTFFLLPFPVLFWLFFTASVRNRIAVYSNGTRRRTVLCMGSYTTHTGTSFVLLLTQGEHIYMCGEERRPVYVDVQAYINQKYVNSIRYANM